jgi:hypothetical protein
MPLLYSRKEASRFARFVAEDNCKCIAEESWDGSSEQVSYTDLSSLLCTDILT